MNLYKAVFLTLVAAFLFAAMSALVRYTGQTAPVGQVVFFRAAFAIVPVVLIYALRRELYAAVHTKRPFGHVGRGLFGVGGMFFQQVSHVTRGDVLFAVSTKAYSPDVVKVVRESAERGVPVIALTDSPLSPLVEHASVSLEVQEASVQMFRSLAVPMTLAVTLVVGLGRAIEAKRSRRTTKKRAQGR